MQLNDLYQATHAGLARDIYLTPPAWLTFYVTAGAAIGLVTNIGLWFWKRRAIIVLATASVVALFTHIFILNLGKVQETTFYLTIALTTLWFFAISRKWQYFE